MEEGKECVKKVAQRRSRGQWQRGLGRQKRRCRALALFLTPSCPCLLPRGLTSTAPTLFRVLIYPLPPFSLPIPHCRLCVSESLSFLLLFSLPPSTLRVPPRPCPPKTILLLPLELVLVLTRRLLLQQEKSMSFQNELCVWCHVPRDSR